MSKKPAVVPVAAKKSVAKKPAVVPVAAKKSAKGVKTLLGDIELAPSEQVMAGFHRVGIEKTGAIIARSTSSAGPCITKREVAAVPATKTSKAVEAHTEWYFTLNGLTALVDPRDLCKTLGAAQWGNGFGLVDSWGNDVWEAVLQHLGLPYKPLDRVAARWVMLRVVESAWIREFGSFEQRETFESAKFAARDADAKAAYLKAFASVEKATVGREAGIAKARVTKGETSYMPTDRLKAEGLKIGGQAATLLAFFRASKWAPTTTTQAADGMVKHGMVTTTKPARIAAFYLCQWVKNGLLERA